MAVSPFGHRAPVRPVGAQRSTPEVVLRIFYALAVALLPLAVIGVEAFAKPSFAWDFRALYQAGHDYLHLHSPYVSGSLAQLSTQDNFVYPLPIAAIFAPVSLIPYTVAAVSFVAFGAGSLVLAVRLLGVRDWRCYACVLLSVPAISGIGLGTVSPLLALLLALLWRFRDRMWIAAAVLSLLVLAKLFLWPVALWLLLTRRLRTVGVALIACALAVLLTALPLGLHVVTHYPSLLRSLSSFEGPMSLSLMSLGAGLSGSAVIGTVLTGAAGLLVFFGLARAARRGDDSLGFRLSIVAALAMSPIVWNHYLILLYVSLALTQPRFSAVWLASAWILGDGALLDHTALIVLTAAAWVVIVVQSDAFPLRSISLAGARIRPVVPALSLGVALCPWVGLIWVVGVMAAAVPGAAALTPPQAGGTASGTALVRVLRGRDAICWRVIATGVPAHTHLEIFENDQRHLLIDRTMKAGRSEACVGYSSGAGKQNLASAYQAGQIGLWLRVISPAGHDLLHGQVMSDMNALLHLQPKR
jgi:alpha-1,2-mannosyltransferase